LTAGDTEKGEPFGLLYHTATWTQFKHPEDGDRMFLRSVWTNLS